MKSKKYKVVILAGPTAVGKSKLAVELAEGFGAEIISADSIQVYKYMNIGSAKATMVETLRVPHHAIDIVTPEVEFMAADYREHALKAVKDITERGKRVFIVGGTGLYIRALIDGLFPGPGANPELRAELMERAEREGPLALYEELRGVDKVSADKIHPNNVVRVIRALEVYKETGRPISELHSEHGEAPSEFDPLCIALGRDRTELRARIDARVEKMMDGGLLREVESLFDRGYDASLKSMNSLGYKEMAGHINGALELDDAISNIKLNTKRYAKRQFTWFGNDKDYKWFDIGEKTDIITRIKEYYKDNDND